MAFKSNYCAMSAQQKRVVAEAAGVNVFYLTRAVHGAFRPSAPKALRIARAINEIFPEKKALTGFDVMSFGEEIL